MYKGFKKNFLCFLCLILLAAGNLFAMGGDGGAEKQIPLPEKNYSVILTDAQGVETRASRVSIDGKIYIRGKRGEATTTVPFEKIMEISRLAGESAPQGAVSTQVSLRSGKKIQLNVKSTTKCFGETEFGKFEIYIRDIKSVKFN